KPYRAIPFSLEHPKHLADARDQLKKATEAVLQPGYKVENPVTRARGFAEISQHGMPGLEVVLADLDALKSQVQGVEQMASAAHLAATRALTVAPSLGAVRNTILGSVGLPSAGTVTMSGGSGSFGVTGGSSGNTI